MLRFEIFKVVKIHVKVFWVMTPCSDVVGYQHFRGPCCLHLNSLHPDDEDSKVLQNVGILQHNPEDLNLNH
jgi:hypothetical protein